MPVSRTIVSDAPILEGQHCRGPVFDFQSTFRTVVNQVLAGLIHIDICLELTSDEPTLVAGVGVVVVIGAIAVVEAVLFLALFCSGSMVDHCLIEFTNFFTISNGIPVGCHIFECLSSASEFSTNRRVRSKFAVACTYFSSNSSFFLWPFTFDLSFKCSDVRFPFCLLALNSFSYFMESELGIG